MSHEAMGSGLGIALFLILFPFQHNQDVADNFEAVDLSWVKDATDPLEVLRQQTGLFGRPLQDQQ